MQVYKYASMQVCKYENMQVYKYTHVYIKSQIKRKKGDVHMIACKISLITTLTKPKFQNM